MDILSQEGRSSLGITGTPIYQTVNKKSALEINDTVESVTDINDEEDIRKNPLQNPLIINHFFNFLGLDDIKKCRLVCKKWNDISLSFLDKSSAIKIGCPNEGNEFEEMSPKSFKKLSKDSKRIFHAFKLKSFTHHKAVWPESTLVGFLQDQKQITQELNIQNIEIAGYKNNPFSLNPIENYFSISQYISNHLAHLVIDGSGGSKFIVSTDKLPSVNSLSLTHCALNVVQKAKLSVKKLELKNVAIYKDKKLTYNVLANELIDFSNLKELTLTGKSIVWTWDTRNVDIAMFDLDMSEKVNLDKLSLNWVTIENFEKSEWQINGKFKLEKIAFKKPTQMKFTELEFRSEDIYLDALPESIEKLTLLKEADTSRPLKITSSPLLSLPNLKHLELFTEATSFRRPRGYGENDSSHEDQHNDNEVNEVENRCNDVNANAKESYNSQDGNTEAVYDVQDDNAEDGYNGQEGNTEKDFNGEDGNAEDGNNGRDDNEEDESYDSLSTSDDAEESVYSAYEDDFKKPLHSLALFANCENLASVKLFSRKYQIYKSLAFTDQDFNSDWIPPSTKNLYLTGNIRAIAGEETKLEKLVIQDNHLDHLIDTVRRLKSNHLVLDLNSKFLKWTENLEEIILTLIDMQYDSLVIGSLALTKTQFRKSLLANYVDQHSAFYVFKNKKGKSITEWQFKRMAK